MGMAKIAITLDEQLLGRLDRLVQDHVFPSHSRAIQEAVAYRLDSLARECAKLDPAEEKTLAEESMVTEGNRWFEY